MNIAELAVLARRRLPRGLYEYLDRGAEDEVTMRGNAESIKRAYLRQRVAVDVSRRDAATNVFGIRQALPIGIAARPSSPARPLRQASRSPSARATSPHRPGFRKSAVTCFGG
jgi:hypothetical protein